MSYKTGLLALALCAVLTACENIGEDPQPMTDVADVSNFTTMGKPTKSVETPWGVKEVHDRAQDPDVIAAFENVTNIRRRYDPNKYCPQTNPPHLTRMSN